MFRFFSMRISLGWRMSALLALGLMVVAGRVEAQGISYLVQAPTNCAVSNIITFNVSLTNQAGSVNITMTNTFVGTTFQLGAVTTGLGTYSVGSTNVIFQLGPMTNSQVTTMTMAVTPTSTGSLSNLFSFATNGVLIGFGSFTPVVQVTNPAPVAGLVVAMTGPAAQVFSNDWMVYNVNVTNLGPSAAPGIFLTNTLPPGVGYKTNSLAFKRLGSDSNVVFNLGTLTNQAFINFQLTVQPTNAGTFTFSSVLSTNGLVIPNPASVSDSITVVVSNFLSNPGQLTGTIVSTQKYNFLSGRLEQNIVLSNAGPTSVDSARLTVTGLTNRLSNATGTNNGNPFVTYAASLAAGKKGYLVLQFSPTQIAFPFTNSQLRADGVTLPNLAPAADGLIPTNIVQFVRLSSGGMVIAFPSLTNRTYTVEYCTNLVSPIWLAAQPLTYTPANYTFWIDYGPPLTVSHPTNTPARFYRVFLNP